MRLDYKEERVLAFTLFWALGVLFGGWLGLVLNMAVWGGLVGGLLVLVVFARVCRWDGWDFLDATILLGYGYGILYFGFVQNLIGVFGALFGGLLVFLTHRLYRSWRWYKSGKLGLSGLVGVGFWGGLMLGMDFDQLPGWIGAIVLVISVVAILLRSRVSLRKS